METYTYNITDYFSSLNEIDTVQLCKEISNNANINKTLLDIEINEENNTLIITFDQALSQAEESTLISVLESHVPAGADDIQYIYDINMTGNRIKNVGTPVEDLDAVNKIYVDHNVSITGQDAIDHADQLANNIINTVIPGIQINDIQGAPVSAVVGVSDSQTLTNKQISAFENTITNIANANINPTAGINVTKIGMGDVNNQELSRLSGLSSNAQNQFDNLTANLDSHTTNTQNPHNVTKQQVGLKDVQNIKCNYDSTRNPTNLDDIFGGYARGSIWINNETEKAYICINNAEMNAYWIETTNIGEITQNINVGSGAGVYLEKINSTHSFKSLQGSVNVSLHPGANEITIHSRDSHSFLLSPIIIEATHTDYSDIIFFPWLHSEFGGYTNGKLIFETVIDQSSMGVRIVNVTESSSILGSIDEITESGFYSLTIANPPENARLKLQIKKSSGGGSDPRIYGIVLKYET